ncbi:MAG: hypothetical protein A2201_10710 [Alicyclobacillus sp. RIFOXYA1_FULL_53_8]|nr:MAG: hypothetical protein A2201_10710 [Alicyclobacillus sp. RIFOXYA1_FULL_53_8]
MPTLLSRLWHQVRGWVGAAPSLLVLFILIAYPMASLLIQIVLPHLFDVKMSFTPSLQPFFKVFTSKGNLTAVIDSLAIGAVAAVFATVIGTVTAFGSAKAPRGVRAVMNGAIWIVFFTPSYVIAEGWLILMQDGGILSQVFHLPNGWSAWFFTRFGLVITMGFRYFPFVHMAMEQAIANVGTEFVNAGRMLGASRAQRFRKIILPLLTPALLAGGSIAFAEGFGDFGFAAAISPQVHIPLISYQIYSALNQAPVDYPAAAGLSLLLILVTGGTLLLQMWWLGRRTYVTISSGSKVNVPPAGRRMSGATIASLIIAVVALVLPLGSTFLESLWNSNAAGLTFSNLSWQNYAQAMQVGGNGLQALTRSFTYSLIAAVITMTIGLFVAHQMAFRKSAATRILNLVTMATIAIPGVVLAAAFIFAWNAVWLIPIHLVLYGTSWVLGMAYVAGHLPYAIRLQLGAMSQLSPNLMTAARVLGAKNTTILRKVVVPLVQATTISTFFLTFTDTMFELPASSLLYPAGEPPFPVLINSKFQAFEWGQGAALAMIGLLFVIVSYAIGQFITSKLASKGGSKKQSVSVDADVSETEVLVSRYS